MAIFIYILWAQLGPDITGKVQVSHSFLLFLVNSGSMLGTARGQCRVILIGALAGRSRVRKLAPQQRILRNSSRLEGACSHE